MDKLEKALAKLAEGEWARVKDILVRLRADDTKGLNIKKLKGREDIFRVRKEDIRILYRTEGKHIFVLAIERKSEKTYQLK